MSKIAISAESTIDLPKELLQKYNIEILPYTVILGDVENLDGEIKPQDIFDYVAKTKKLPKTSAINREQYSVHFKKLLENYDAVIHLTLSSQISSSCEHAKEVASQMENVYIVDTKSLSTGIALLAIYAKELADGGKSAREVYEAVLKRVPFVQASFVLKKLDYLYKGGRCSALKFFGANLLKIRPQIIMKDGKMGPNHKYRGTMEKVVASYCKDTLQDFNTPDLSVAFVTYTTASQEMVDIATNALKERGFKQIYVTVAGSTITSHCGEDTLGILYINDGEAK